jgi:hypothetical protein
MKEKNLALVLDEAEAETAAALNIILQKHGLPCYLFEPILDKLHRQILDGKAAEIAAAKAEMGESHESDE